MEIINDFIARFPKFKLLPAEALDHQIIAEGIDLALTVYGTIGFEYAALDIPVINCSLNNLHIAYDFNLHPKNIDEYRCLLLDLDEIELKINKREVYAYYFMRHIYCNWDLFFDSCEGAVKALDGYSSLFTDDVYEMWMAE